MLDHVLFNLFSLHCQRRLIIIKSTLCVRYYVYVMSMLLLLCLRYLISKLLLLHTAIQLKLWFPGRFSLILVLNICHVYVVVQFFPWFKFYFPLFKTHYHTLPYPKTKENKI